MAFAQIDVEAGPFALVVRRAKASKTRGHAANQLAAAFDGVEGRGSLGRRGHPSQQRHTGNDIFQMLHL